MKNKRPKIGVLALQGAVDIHRPHIEAASASFLAVKTIEECKQADAFILPGGESTTMLKLIERFALWDALGDQFSQKPVWGICAGSILLAEKVTNPAQKSFRLLPIEIERNGYGRQLQSHQDIVSDFEVSFIRAPLITAINGDVDVFVEKDGHPVWIKKGPIMATTFHPELTLEFPSPMHKAFIDLVKEK